MKTRTLSFKSVCFDRFLNDVTTSDLDVTAVQRVRLLDTGRPVAGGVVRSEVDRLAEYKIA